MRVVHVLLLDHRLEGHVAEQRNLLAQFLVERLLAAADQDVRGDADFAQLGDGLLRGLGLQFAGRLDERHVGDVDEDGVVVPDFERELADGFEERQPLDVAGGAADLGDDHVGLGLLGQHVDAVLDFVGDVRDDLHGLVPPLSVTPPQPADSLAFKGNPTVTTRQSVTDQNRLGMADSLTCDGVTDQSPVVTKDNRILKQSKDRKGKAGENFFHNWLGNHWHFPANESPETKWSGNHLDCLEMEPDWPRLIPLTQVALHVVS